MLMDVSLALKKSLFLSHSTKRVPVSLSHSTKRVLLSFQILLSVRHRDVSENDGCNPHHHLQTQNALIRKAIYQIQTHISVQHARCHSQQEPYQQLQQLPVAQRWRTRWICHPLLHFGAPYHEDSQGQRAAHYLPQTHL
jgi:hypothetical protein